MSRARIVSRKKAAPSFLEAAFDPTLGYPARGPARIEDMEREGSIDQKHGYVK